jgi:uridine kinase
MRNTVKQIEQNIPDLKDGERFLLGIDGLSRAGKTTITEHLSHLLLEKNISHVVIHLDDLIETKEKRYNTGHEQWEEYYYLQWDVDKLKQSLFEKCKTAPFLKLPFYESEKDQQHMKEVTLPPTCVIVIEGVFLQREAWRNYFDFMVYMEASKDKRFSREVNTTKRQIDKFEKHYWKAEAFYLETTNPVHKADLVVQN